MLRPLRGFLLALAGQAVSRRDDILISNRGSSAGAGAVLGVRLGTR